MRDARILCALVLAATACWAAPWSAHIPQPPVEVRLTNLLHVQQPLHVHLVLDDGSRRFVGTVIEGDSRTFEVGLSVSPGLYRLVASTPNGWSRTSPAFLLDDGDRVAWNVPDNTIAIVDHLRTPATPRHR